MTPKRKPFTIIDNDIVDSKDLSGQEKLVYMILCRHADEKQSCYPSYNTIAEKAGLSRRKAIDVIANLIEKGLLEKKLQRHGNGDNTANLYRLLPLHGAGDSPPNAQDAPASEPPAPPSESPAPKQDPIKKDPYNKNQSINLIGDGLIEHLGEHFSRPYFAEFEKDRLHLVDTLIEYMADMLTRPHTRISGVDYSRDTISHWIYGAHCGMLIEFMNHMDKQDIKHISNLKGYYCTAMIEFFREYRILTPPLPYDDSS